MKYQHDLIRMVTYLMKSLRIDASASLLCEVARLGGYFPNVSTCHDIVSSHCANVKHDGFSVHRSPSRNTIQFTPTQIEAIRAGMQPGLTMVRASPCSHPH